MEKCIKNKAYRLDTLQAVIKLYTVPANT